jgi:hypothetical protein
VVKDENKLVCSLSSDDVSHPKEEKKSSWELYWDNKEESKNLESYLIQCDV